MLDTLDIQILRLLERNSRISYTDISKSVQMSRPSVVERMNKLIEKGIIERFTMKLSVKKVGRPIAGFLHISNMKPPLATMLELLQRKEVIEVYSVTGENNFIAKVAVKDMEEMEVLLSDLMPFCRIVTSLIIIDHNVDRFIF